MKYRQTILSSVLAATLGLGVSTAHAEGSLSIYHWFEYIPQELLDKFAKENDVEVTMDTFDSNELYAGQFKGRKNG